MRWSRLAAHAGLVGLAVVLGVPSANATDPPPGKRAAEGIDPQEINRLIGRLGGDRFADREEAGKRLVAIGSPALEPLRRATRAGDHEVARRAAECIRQIERQARIAALTKSVGSKDAGERAAAAEALTRFGSAASPAVPALTRAVTDPDHAVRFAAARALVCIGPPAKPALPTLLNLLKDRHAGDDVRWTVAKYMGDITKRAPEAVPVLLAMLEEPSPDVRNGAAYGLVRFGRGDKRVVPALLRALKGARDVPTYGAAAAALGDLGEQPDVVVPALVEQLRADKRKVFKGVSDPRQPILYALRRFGPAARAAIPALIDIAQGRGETSQARRHAVEMLGDLGPAASAALPCLRAIAAEGGSVGSRAQKAIASIEGRSPR